MRAWDAIGRGDPNPLETTLSSEPAVKQYLGAAEVADVMDPAKHTGLAAQRAREFASKIRELIGGSGLEAAALLTEMGIQA